MKNIEKYYEELMNVGNHCGCYWHKNILGKKNCDGKNCIKCGRQFLQWLKSEYKGPIKLTKFEFDMLLTSEKDHCELGRLSNNLYFVGLKEKGYFKNVDLNMTAKEVLAIVIAFDIFVASSWDWL